MRLGAWGEKMNLKEYEHFIDQCVEMGLTDFDHADIYGHYTTEQEFGEVLKKRKDLRSKIQITTKCGIKMVSVNRPDHIVKSYDSTSEHIEKSVDQSLSNFDTDYLDVLLLHRPDFLMDPEAIASTFEKLKKSGKVRYFGVSNFSPSQVSLISTYTELITNQVEISLINLERFEDGTLDLCLERNIRPSAWSPLGGGILFSDEPTSQKDRILACCHDLCEKYNCSIDQLLLAWLMKHPAKILPVLGSTKVLRIASAIEATQIRISHEDWYSLFQASKGEIIA